MTDAERMTNSVGPCRPLPDKLGGLAELALDLRVAGSPIASRLWRWLDAEAFERSGNPHMVLQNVAEQRLEEAAADEQFLAELRRCREWYAGYFDARSGLLKSTASPNWEALRSSAPSLDSAKPCPFSQAVRDSWLVST